MTQQEHESSSLQSLLGKWESHFDRVSQSDSLSESEKTEVISGLEKLRKVFDDAWLWETSKVGFVHPLIGNIANYAPWSLFWLADFWRKLAALKGLVKFEELGKRLRDSKEYGGAKAEVETVVRLVDAGITEVELYPKVSVRNKEKKPDLRAVVDGEDFYFEVTSLGDSEKSRKAWDTFSELALPSFDPALIHFLQVHKILSKPHRNELKTKMLQANREVKETKEHRYVGEPGVLDYLVIHQSKQAECDTLVERYGVRKENTGPAFQSDDVERLKLRLKKKSEQLPRDKPAIIVVSGSITYYSGSPESFYDNLVSQVEETIYDQDNLILGVIINVDVGRGQASRIEKTNYVLVRTSRNLLAETVIVLKNRYSKFHVNEKILSAFAR